MSGCSAVQPFLVGVLSGTVSGAVAGGIYVCVLIERANLKLADAQRKRAASHADFTAPPAEGGAR